MLRVALLHCASITAGYAGVALLQWRGEQCHSYDHHPLRTRITTCYSDRVETGPYFVPGSPRVVAHSRRVARVAAGGYATGRHGGPPPRAPPPPRAQCVEREPRTQQPPVRRLLPPPAACRLPPAACRRLPPATRANPECRYLCAQHRAAVSSLHGRSGNPGPSSTVPPKTADFGNVECVNSSTSTSHSMLAAFSINHAILAAVGPHNPGFQTVILPGFLSWVVILNVWQASYRKLQT